LFQGGLTVLFRYPLPCPSKVRYFDSYQTVFTTRNSRESEPHEKLVFKVI
jgi:hypothetical protein